MFLQKKTAMLISSTLAIKEGSLKNFSHIDKYIRIDFWKFLLIFHITSNKLFQ